MKRTWLLWFSFALCLAVVVAAMGWISLTVLRLDQAEAAARRQEAEARRQAAQEEKVRLALWRADSVLAPLVSQESVRPWFVYRAFFPADQAYTRMFNEKARGERLVPSPLLTAALPPNVLVYFQFEPDGQLTSPQVPGNGPHNRNYDLAVPRHVPREAVQEARSQLAALNSLANRGRLLTLLPERPPVPVQVVVSPPTPGNASSPGQQQAVVPQGQKPGPPAQPQPGPQQQAALPQQSSFAQSGQASDNNSFLSPLNQSAQQRASVKNRRMEMQREEQQDAVEYEARQNLLFQSTNAYAGNTTLNNGVLFFNGGTLPSTDISGVPMTPLWIEGRLLLARRVAVNGEEYVQGCLLNWPAIRDTLRDTVADLLPESDFEPAPKPSRDEARMLAALPVRLLPGSAALAPLEDQLAAVDDLFSAESLGGGTFSPLRVSLGAAWVGMILAALAVAGLLAGVMRLSARRASFVTAVTHELRTPLTTFQVYTEMLAEGMVPEGPPQRQYLATLRAESVRLTHMVENVLSYARLERGRTDGRRESLGLAELVERMRGRLAGRAEQAGMELVVEGDEAAREAMISVNVAAVEQIIFNLVDNACKYACEPADRRIHLALAAGRGMAEVSVRDHGPGLSPGVQRRLFQPFSKSAREAAHSAPGVGLGLALSRRLACDMGGDLRLQETAAGGACFVLALPIEATL
jgi:signal transduction histidine kinase